MLITDAKMACAYLPGQTSWLERINGDKFDALSRGHIAQGPLAYRLKCEFCNACVALRINTDKAFFSKNQRQVIRSNSDLSLNIQTSRFDPEFLPLFKAYLRARHPNSPMAAYKTEQLQSVVCATSHQMVVKDKRGNVIAVACVDFCNDDANLEYLFFDPDPQSKRSLGTYCWLKLIAVSQASGVKHLYMGSWAAESAKLRYKQRFHGIEAYTQDGWVDFDAQRQWPSPYPDSHNTPAIVI